MLSSPGESVPYKPVAVHVCTGRLAGLGAPAAGIYRQQRGAHTVP